MQTSLRISLAALLIGYLWETISPGPSLIAQNGIPPEKLPPALRGMNSDRLSSGTYWALAAGAGVVRWPEPESASARTSHLARQGATAVLDPKVGPNVRFGDDPAELPASRRAQAEPHVARSFGDTNLVVATFQEGRFEDYGAVDCGYAISHDGGLTWTRALIPHLTELVGGPFDRASDPVAGVDLQNNVFINTIGIHGPESLDVVLSKSTDGGVTFSEPLTVFTSPTTNAFPDKNWMAINTFPGTPTADRIVATFTYFIRTNVPPFQSQILITPIVSTYSDDGGSTWSPLSTISPPNCQGSQPVFLPDGSLAVIYWNFWSNASLNAGGEHIEVVLSSDGGQTYGEPRLVAPVNAYSDSVARNARFLPSAATDRQAGVLYVAYQAQENGPRVLFTKSIDKGRTWSRPMPVNDSTPGVSVFNPAITVSPDGQHVSIIFYDKRNGIDANFVDLYLAESFDGGDTWKANLRLSAVSSDLRLAPLTPTGRMLGDYQGMVPALNSNAPAVAIWVDTRSGSPDPFSVQVKRTQGTTFETWRTLRFNPAELADPALSAAQGQPAGDGLSNLFKYAVGLEPAVPSASPLLMAGTSSDPGRTIALTCQRLAMLSDLDFSLLASTDLVSWQTFVPVGETVEPVTDPAKEAFIINVPLGLEPTQFFRLGVTKAR
ncbi:MAG: exo-alpha-sialidase [Chloroflexi bacterium]|nr:exo-alpha-sialidase [Chloroflexota bacterium]